MKQYHELVSKESFELWLNQEYPSSAWAWEDVPLSAEPPDWFITSESESYALEATTIVEKLPGFGENVSTVSVAVAIKRLCKELEHEAINKEILNGAFLVNLPPFPDFHKHKKDIYSKLLSYIFETRFEEEAPEKIYGFIRDEQVSIMKIKSDKLYIGEMISFGARTDEESLSILVELLQKSITTKSKLLKKVSLPIILLLLDGFNYLDLQNWLKCINQISIPQNIHSVFRTEKDIKAQLLFSRNISWK
jgi:hypothetical protein